MKPSQASSPLRAQSSKRKTSRSFKNPTVESTSSNPDESTSSRESVERNEVDSSSGFVKADEDETQKEEERLRRERARREQMDRESREFLFEYDDEDPIHTDQDSNVREGKCGHNEVDGSCMSENSYELKGLDEEFAEGDDQIEIIEL